MSAPLQVVSSCVFVASCAVAFYALIGYPLLLKFLADSYRRRRGTTQVSRTELFLLTID